MILNKLFRKRRAVSPVIAVILLIGLTVLAGAAISMIVIPMLSTDVGPGGIKTSVTGNTLTITNENNAAVELLNVTCYDGSTNLGNVTVEETIKAGAGTSVTLLENTTSFDLIFAEFNKLGISV